MPKGISKKSRIATKHKRQTKRHYLCLIIFSQGARGYKGGINGLTAQFRACSELRIIWKALNCFAVVFYPLQFDCKLCYNALNKSFW
jgi:hypothetical protein